MKLEANAFVTFLTRLADNKDLDLAHAAFVGYSNGANLLAATMLLHPDLVKRAVLMRSLPVLDDAPVANLGKAHVLTIAGEHDKLYSPYAPALSAIPARQRRTRRCTDYRCRSHAWRKGYRHHSTVGRLTWTGWRADGFNEGEVEGELGQ